MASPEPDIFGAAGKAVAHVGSGLKRSACGSAARRSARAPPATASVPRSLIRSSFERLRNHRLVRKFSGQADFAVKAPAEAILRPAGTRHNRCFRCDPYDGVQAGSIRRLWGEKKIQISSTKIQTNLNDQIPKTELSRLVSVIEILILFAIWNLNIGIHYCPANGRFNLNNL
ncbi:hypothetical protein [Planctomicrobium piriforme]|uniref:hypothetical protein n=1 Tax=Planctomicrobium piriforme TaxID=1576369 RepID=UPI000B85C3C0|nr:hypothetical protein [Planctomicrobium piriforme]